MICAVPYVRDGAAPERVAAVLLVEADTFSQAERTVYSLFRGRCTVADAAELDLSKGPQVVEVHRWNERAAA